MGAILEVKYFNSFWTKRIATGQVNPITNGAGAPAPNVYGEANTTGTYPGPVAFGDAISGIGNQEIYGIRYSDFTGSSNFAPAFPNSANDRMAETLRYNWFCEDSTIRGGFGNNTVDFGVRAYLNEDEPLQERRFNSLIYSGVFNSRTGLNATNVFSVGESITKSLEPAYGSIQKLYAEDTNLIIFQENKVNGALIDKDAIYSAEGGGTVTSSQLVIGQTVPYLGEFGISQNPESFAVYGFQKYFADKDRSSIMRLSRDGLTPISKYGMNDYFRDELAKVDNEWKNYYVTATLETTGTVTVFNITNSTISGNLQIGSGIQISSDNGINYGPDPTVAYITNIVVSGNSTIITSSSEITLPATDGLVRFVSPDRGRIRAGWDIYSLHYLLSLQTNSRFTSNDSSTYQTLTFEEAINGWTSRFSFKPSKIFSVENKTFSIDQYGLYEHFDETVPNNRGFWYDQPYNSSSVNFLFNTDPLVVKNFNTIGYEGGSGWKVDYFTSDEEGYDFMETVNNQNLYSTFEDETTVVYSFLEGKYEIYDPTKTGISAVSPPYAHAGFARKENRYVSALIQKQTVTTKPSSYPPRPGEVIFGNQMSGIKGFFANVQMSTDTVTQPGGEKELFSVSSNIVKSS